MIKQLAGILDTVSLNEIDMKDKIAKFALINGNYQELKNLANTIISAQNKEIEEMKSWKNSWFNQ